MKRNYALMALLVSILCWSGCDQDAYTRGYDRGHTEGYQSGYTDGHRESQTLAVDSGFVLGYSSGYYDGKSGKPSLIEDNRPGWKRLGVYNIVILILLDVMWFVLLANFIVAMLYEMRGAPGTSQSILLIAPIGLAAFAFLLLFVVLEVRLVNLLSQLSIYGVYLVSIVSGVCSGFIVWSAYKLKKTKIDVLGQVITLTVLSFITFISVKLGWDAYELTGGIVEQEPVSVLILCLAIGSLLAIIAIGFSIYSDGKRLYADTSRTPPKGSGQ
ncbi:MAG: hypothetical protein AB1483_12855 [Candidatus Zixiibacteriota bacterium]